MQIVLEPLPTHTQYVPLAVLGYCLTSTGFLQPVWDEIDWAMKTIRHVPTEKLQDMLVSILAGNKHDIARSEWVPVGFASGEEANAALAPRYVMFGEGWQVVVFPDRLRSCAGLYVYL